MLAGAPLPMATRRAAVLVIRATAAVLAACPPAARAQQVDVAASELAFVTRMMGAPVEGRFTRWQAQLQFDPRRPAAAQITLRVDMTSARFPAAEVSAEAQRPVWFDGARFAEARFQSTAVKPLADNRFEIEGRLELKGRTHDLRVPVALARYGNSASATGSFVIRRLDYGVGDGEWADTSLVANDVQVRFRLALNGLGSASTP